MEGELTDNIINRRHHDVNKKVVYHFVMHCMVLRSFCWTN